MHSKYPKRSFQKIKTSKKLSIDLPNYKYRLHQPIVDNNKSQKLTKLRTSLFFRQKGTNSLSILSNPKYKLTNKKKYRRKQ